MKYTSLESMEQKLNIIDRSHAFTAETPETLLRWQQTTRLELQRLLGLGRLKPCPLDPHLLEVYDMDNIRREKWDIAVEEGVRMPFYVLFPQRAFKSNTKLPVLIAPHGHGSGGKEGVAGASDKVLYKDRRKFHRAVKEYNNAYGLEFARRGFTVLCPDARGFGERREADSFWVKKEGVLESSCRRLANMALGLGLCLTGLWIWDLMRLLDFIPQHSNCDTGRIGCVGFSGGGLQALWLSALDERISCAVISGYFYGYRDSLLLQNGNCSCNYVPGLWERVDMGELGALIAPRPLLIESGRQDHHSGHRGIPNVLEQVEVSNSAYKLLGAEKNLCHKIYDGHHRWYGVDAYPFMVEHLESF